MKKYIKLFLPLCGILALIIPLFHINTAEITEQENRALAKFSEMTKGNKSNYEFGKEFESWLGDRFWGRDQLINYKSAFEYILEKNYIKNGVVKGKNGWLFWVCNHNTINLSQKAIIALEKLERYCDSRNIKLFLVLLPRSCDIYKEYYPLQYNEKLNNETMEFYNNTRIITINPIPALQYAKEFKTFFKKDDHWTDYGALITYEEFEKKLRGLYPDYQFIQNNDFKISLVEQEKYSNGVTLTNFCKRIALPNFLCESEKYPLYQYKNEIIHKNISGKLKSGVNSYTNKNAYPLRALMIGKSFTDSFGKFLTAAIREVLIINMNNLYANKKPSFIPYRNLVEDYKPNILILLVHVDQLGKFMEDI